MNLVEEQILKPMELVRSYVHLFEKLRKQMNIPLRQPLLDFAYGSNNFSKTSCLLKDERALIPPAINIHGADENNTGFDTVKPTGEHWVFLEENDLWVALYNVMPDWLKSIGDKRKEEREKIMQRKEIEYAI